MQFFVGQQQIAVADGPLAGMMEVSHSHPDHDPPALPFDHLEMQPQGLRDRMLRLVANAQP
jgi:hypothetical protein